MGSVWEVRCQPCPTPCRHSPSSGSNGSIPGMSEGSELAEETWVSERGIMKSGQVESEVASRPGGPLYSWGAKCMSFKDSRTSWEVK